MQDEFENYHNSESCDDTGLSLYDLSRQSLNTELNKRSYELSMWHDMIHIKKRQFIILCFCRANTKHDLLICVHGILVSKY